MKSNKSILKLFASSTLIAALGLGVLVPFNMGGCASDNPMTQVGNAIGGREGALISAGGKAASAISLGEEDENAMGQSVAVTVTNRYGVTQNERLIRYVTLVGMTVASVTPRADGNFVFGVVDSNEVNAFSGPNGYIMITRGAIAQMKDESELAGVLAHEIAHVCNQDGLKAVKQAGYLDAAVTASTADERGAQFAVATDGLVDVILKKGYSRDQETAADKEAVTYLIAAGYDPTGFESFLARIAHDNKGGALSTHPGGMERVNKVQERIEKKQEKAGGARMQERFVAMTK